MAVATTGNEVARNTDTDEAMMDTKTLNKADRITDNT